MSSSESEEEESEIEDSEFCSPLSQDEIVEDTKEIVKTEEARVEIFCRLCAARTQNPIFIFSDFGKIADVEGKINNCLSLKVRKSDDLPKQICVACLEKLSFCAAFDEQCQRAEETLREIFCSEKSSSGPEKCCPLCSEGLLQVFENEEDSKLYDPDVILSTSDEEALPQNLKVSSRPPGPEIVTLTCFEKEENFFKCRACTNLFRSDSELDSHVCKIVRGNSTNRRFVCDVCASGFFLEERLIFHRSLHDKHKPLTCEVCSQSFPKESKLFLHYKRYHTTNPWISCPQCGRLFPKIENLKSHVCVDGKNRRNVCGICFKGFVDTYTLKRHMLTHLPEKPFCCGRCGKGFTQKSRLNKHVSGHVEGLEDVQRVWRCETCGQVFPTLEYSKTHDQSHSTIYEETLTKLYHCEFCELHFSNPTTLKAHTTMNHYLERPYECKSCSITFEISVEASQHWRTHENLNFKVQIVFLCQICGKETKDHRLLQKHIRKRHWPTLHQSEDGSQRFFCHFCGRAFETSLEIEEHSQKNCSKFNCDVCGAVLPTMGALTAHKRRHSGLRPYVCNICGKSYTQSSHMWTHKRFHMGVKPYACEYCDKRFTIKPDLADHTRKKHTRERPFKCEVCKKAFLTGSVFYQHRLIHRGDRRYKCKICNKAFTRTEALNNHVRIHTGEKPHECDVCGRRFRQKGDMRKHRRTQHSNK